MKSFLIASALVTSLINPSFAAETQMGETEISASLVVGVLGSIYPELSPFYATSVSPATFLSTFGDARAKKAGKLMNDLQAYYVEGVKSPELETAISIIIDENAKLSEPDAIEVLENIVENYLK